MTRKSGIFERLSLNVNVFPQPGSKKLMGDDLKVV
jgi:hypothetical protein